MHLHHRPFTIPSRLHSGELTKEEEEEEEKEAAPADYNHGHDEGTLIPKLVTKLKPQYLNLLKEKLVPKDVVRQCNTPFKTDFDSRYSK
ncbi:hypothetical protein Hanom_Chr11g01024901 [Helianthus anomalus]